MSEEKKEAPIKKDIEDINELQGFGEKLSVFIGVENGEPKSKEYHIAPVPIKEIPALVKTLSEFQEAVLKAAGETLNFKEKDIKLGAKMVLMGLKRTAPDVTEEEIMENFTLGTLLKASRILIGVNNLPMAQLNDEGQPVPFGKVRRAPKAE